MEYDDGVLVARLIVLVILGFAAGSSSMFLVLSPAACEAGDCSSDPGSCSECQACGACPSCCRVPAAAPVSISADPRPRISSLESTFACSEAPIGGALVDIFHPPRQA